MGDADRMIHPPSASVSHKSNSKIRPEILKEIQEHFTSFCKDGEKTIKVKEVANVLVSCGEKVPAYKIRQVLEKLNIAKKGQISFQDFVPLFEEVAATKISTKLVPFSSKTTIQVTGGQSFVSAQGTQHSYDDDDKIAFAEWVNSILEKDKDPTGNDKELLLNSFAINYATFSEQAIESDLNKRHFQLASFGKKNRHGFIQNFPLLR